MAYIRRSSIWPDPRVKPRPGTAVIDWAHPLAGRMILCLLCDRGGPLIDLVGGTMWTTSGQPKASSPIGRTFDGSSYDTVAVTARPLPPNCTVVLQLRTTTVAGQELFGSVNTANGFNGVNIQIGRLVAGKIATVFDNNGYVSTTSTYNDGATHIFGVSRLSTTGSFYKDGQADGTGTYTGPAMNWAGASYVGNDPFASQGKLIGDIGFVYGYGRALSAGEQLWLAAEPFAMFRPVIRRRWFVPAALPSATPPQRMLIGVGT